MRLRDTLFSSDRKYRYTLYRRLHAPGQTIVDRTVSFICLNPSTADEVENDPTVRRAMGYARGFGGSEFYMLNIFALRSTDPALLYADEDPVGPENDVHIEFICEHSDYIICGWGNHGELHGRGKEVTELLKEYKLHCLGVNANFSPKHPLYLRADLPLRSFPA
jgi:hypothetical protein